MKKKMWLWELTLVGPVGEEQELKEHQVFLTASSFEEVINDLDFEPNDDGSEIIGVTRRVPIMKSLG